MDAQHFPIDLFATVTKPEKFRDVKNRPYQKVGFMVQVPQPNYFDGDDYRAGYPLTVYIDGTKEVADIIAAHDGLRLGERIYLRVVRQGAFGGDGKDTEGRQRTPMVKYNVDHIELPARPFQNQPVKEMAAKVQAKDAIIEAETQVLAGATK